MQDFAHLFTLDHKIAIYVPGTIHATPATELQSIKTDAAANLFASLFGGSTMQRAVGAWRSETGQTITEQINIVYSFCDADAVAANLAAVIDFCKALCKDMDQEAVTLEYDNKCTFITL